MRLCGLGGKIVWGVLWFLLMRRIEKGLGRVETEA